MRIKVKIISDFYPAEAVESEIYRRAHDGNDMIFYEAIKGSAKLTLMMLALY